MSRQVIKRVLQAAGIAVAAILALTAACYAFTTLNKPQTCTQDFITGATINCHDTDTKRGEQPGTKFEIKSRIYPPHLGPVAP